MWHHSQKQPLAFRVLSSAEACSHQHLNNQSEARTWNPSWSHEAVPRECSSEVPHFCMPFLLPAHFSPNKIIPGLPQLSKLTEDSPVSASLQP